MFILGCIDQLIKNGSVKTGHGDLIFLISMDFQNKPVLLRFEFDIFKWSLTNVNQNFQ